MKGIHEEVRVKFHKSVENYIIVSRILQGQDEFRSATIQEKEDITLRFRSIKDTMYSNDASRSRAKKLPASGDISEEYIGPIPDEEPKTGFFQTRHLSLEERRKLHALKNAWRKKNRGEAVGTPPNSSGTNAQSAPSIPSFSTSTAPPILSTAPSILEPENEDMERAIRESVAQTSTGDRDEDARIEAQIRASVQEMRRVAEENRRREQLRDWKVPPPPSLPPPPSSSSSSSVTVAAAAPDWRSSFSKGQEQTEVPNDITDEEYEALIAEAVRQSMMAQAQRQQLQHEDEEDEQSRGSELHGISMIDNTTHPQTYEMGGNEEDEHLIRAMEESMRTSSTHRPPQQQGGGSAGAGAGDDDDDELKRAMEESERAHREHLARASSERTEEEIIMEYVKKQSLAEEEYRRSKAEGKKQQQQSAGNPQAGGNEEEDEDLRRALEESLRMSGKEGGPSS